MSVQNSQPSKEETGVDGDSRDLTFVELTGNDPATWATRRPRFFKRMLNLAKELVRRVAGSKGPRGQTVAQESQSLFAHFISSLHARLDRPILENQKKSIEIFRELESLRASTTKRDTDEVDMVGEARSRRISGEVLSELLASGKIHALKDGDSLTILIQGLNEDDMKAFKDSKGYPRRLAASESAAPNVTPDSDPK